MKLKELQQIIAKAIVGTEFEQSTYFAGGCVRDWLINPATELQEADLCVELKRGGILLAEKLCKELQGSGLVLHPAFGTAGFSFHGRRLEFVATRKEVCIYDSRFERVSYGSLRDDVLRRDFTINALLMKVSSSEVLDLTRLGIADLHQRIIRCVSDPAMKFTEDPLRMVRAMRFALNLGFKLEAETQRALEENRKLINTISKRAINSELAKLEPDLRVRLQSELNRNTDLTDRTD